VEVTTTPELPFSDALLSLAQELKRANDVLEADV